MIANNNISKQLFKNFLKDNDLTSIDHRNAFVYKGKTYGFVVYEDKMECRQFYEDYEGVMFYNLISGKYTACNKNKLLLSKKPTRIMSSGIKAFNAKVK